MKKKLVDKMNRFLLKDFLHLPTVLAAFLPKITHFFTKFYRIILMFSVIPDQTAITAN